MASNEQEVKIMGKVRTFNAENAPESTFRDFALNPRAEQIVAAGLPANAELVRQGGSFGCISAAVAALTAVPTTVAGHSLWNGEPDGPNGKVYVIDSFGAVEIVIDATQANSLALFALSTKGKFAAPTDDATAFASLAGNNYGGKARKISGATVVNDVWMPHGPSSPYGGSALAGDVWRVTEFQANGLYVVGPGGLFSIAAAKVAATASQIRYFIRWHEVRLPVAA